MKRNDFTDAFLVSVFDKTDTVRNQLEDVIQYLNRAYEILYGCIRDDKALTNDEVEELNNLYSYCMEINEAVSVKLAACGLINCVA